MVLYHMMWILDEYTTLSYVLSSIHSFVVKVNEPRNLILIQWCNVLITIFGPKKQLEFKRWSSQANFMPNTHNKRLLYHLSLLYLTWVHYCDFASNVLRCTNLSFSETNPVKIGVHLIYLYVFYAIKYDNWLDVEQPKISTSILNYLV